MAKRQRHHQHEEHMDETWLIPYADLLTLLLALFIVLFATSKIDVKKFEQMIQAFNVVFSGGTGPIQYQAPAPVPIDQPSDSKYRESELEEQLKRKFREETEDLYKLKKQLDDYIKRNQLEAKLTTEVTDLGLMIKISDSALFDSGKAEVRPEGRLLAKEIARLLIPNARKVTVSGHTDNVPIRSAAFASNWELSAARAINFMKIIMENPVLASNPKRFSATAYGEYQPIASNETPEGRAANRRVEVAILRNNPKITLPNVGELQ